MNLSTAGYSSNHEFHELRELATPLMEKEKSVKSVNPLFCFNYISCVIGCIIFVRLHEPLGDGEDAGTNAAAQGEAFLEDIGSEQGAALRHVLGINSL